MLFVSGCSQLSVLQTDKAGGCFTTRHPTNFHQFYTRKILVEGESADDFYEVTVAQKSALEAQDAAWVRPPQAFIDKWNQAAGTRGCYNEQTGFFELNGITDISYEEALQIYNTSVINLNYGRVREMCYYSSTNVRTVMPFRELGIQNSWRQAFGKCFNLEVVSCNGSNCFNVTNGMQMFLNCGKLREILPGIVMENGNNTTEMFKGCIALETVVFLYINCSINLAQSPLWNYKSIKGTIDGRLSHQVSKAITLTVHPDVFAKLTGDTTNAAAAALSQEELTLWMQLLDDAAAKNISFATN